MCRKNGIPRVIGLIAHVDAGKTTTAEALLVHSGVRRTRGRVDRGDAFLDTDPIERRRGITIFSKLARLPLHGMPAILLDTPGHADLVSEVDRALDVIDMALFILDATGDLPGHARLLWDHLKGKHIPVMLFLNKTDRPGADIGRIIAQTAEILGVPVVPLDAPNAERFEAVALSDADLLNEYLETGEISERSELRAFSEGKWVPACAGSALNGDGIPALYDALSRYAPEPRDALELSARAYKITYDGTRRLVHVRLTGGMLEVKSILGGSKIHEIRRYDGEGFEQASLLTRGDIGALIGPENVEAGDLLLSETVERAGRDMPILRYRMRRADGGDETELLREIRRFAEEAAELQPVPASDGVDISARGPVQLEIIEERMRAAGIPVRFEEGRVVYRETISRPAYGIGHFEPLRHYAEVHVRLIPAERNSGVRFDPAGVECPTGVLKKIRETIESTVFPSAGMGFALTDVIIRLAAVRTHPKHTESGDLAQAARRAVRNALMYADSIVLEPYGILTVDSPPEDGGRLLAEGYNEEGDIDCSVETTPDRCAFTARGPFHALQRFLKAIPQITNGRGRATLAFTGYDLCKTLPPDTHYVPTEDPDFPPGSIFCKGGAGYAVPWDQVRDAAHIEVRLPRPRAERPEGPPEHDEDEELEQIFRQTFYSNANPAKQMRPGRRAEPARRRVLEYGKPVMLLIDGYNIIHDWKKTDDAYAGPYDSARTALISAVADYCGYAGERAEIVFDAYLVEGGEEHAEDDGPIRVIYTAEGETADAYIARRSGELKKTHIVKVATSDGAVQTMAEANGALVRSARMLRKEIDAAREAGMRDFRRTAPEPLKHNWEPEE